MYGLMKLKNYPIIFVALIAHHPSIMSCNGILWMDIGFSAPVARVHMPTEMKQGFIVEQSKNGACFFHLNLWNY